VDSWEVGARVAILNTISQYAHAGDRLQLAELAATFVEEGVLEIRDGATLRGRDAIIAFLGDVPASAEEGPGGRGGAMVRHHVASTRFVSVSPEAARVESYFAVYTAIGLDHFGRYRDVFARVDDRWLIQHRYVSVDWTAPQSRFASR
jgi:hypothetical protein